MRDPLRDDDVDREAPGSVVAAVAIGTAPLPIIAVYTIMFLVHGSVRPVQPPDVTSSKDGEFLVGWICLAIFVLLTVALLWLLNGRRRWPFAVLQLGILAMCINFALDDTVSGRFVSVLVAITSLAALVLAYAPASWRYVGESVPGMVDRLWRQQPSGTSPSRVAALRRRRRDVAAGAEPSGVPGRMLRRRPVPGGVVGASRADDNADDNDDVPAAN